MQIDLDEILQRAKPWELNLKIDGRSICIRRLTNLDVQQLMNLGERASEKSTRNLLMSFVGEQDAGFVANWDMERITAAMSAISAYYTEVVIKKNAQDVAQQVRQLSTRSTG